MNTIIDNLNFRVAPRLEIENCRIENLPIRNIPKLDAKLFAQGCSGSVTVWPLPVAIECESGNFELLPDQQYWNTELVGSNGNQLTCLIIPKETPASMLVLVQEILSSLLANRTTQTRKEVYTNFFHGATLKDAIDTAYGYDADEEMLHTLLIANGYCSKQASRIANGEDIGQKSMQNKADRALLKVVRKFDLDRSALNLWDTYAMGKGWLSFAEIVLEAPEDSQVKTVDWMNRKLSAPQVDNQASWGILEPRLKHEVNSDE
jgi:hypothetical protein